MTVINMGFFLIARELGFDFPEFRLCVFALKFQILDFEAI